MNLEKLVKNHLDLQSNKNRLLKEESK